MKPIIAYSNYIRNLKDSKKYPTLMDTEGAKLIKRHNIKNISSK